jgi:hypothetical protein
MIITGDRCVQNSSGDTSIWNQEKILMRDRQSRQSPHPRKQSIKDLITSINDKRGVNHDIMLNLDANETLGKEMQGISKLIRECGLVDLLDMPGIRPVKQLQDTYRRGTNRRINFMLGSQHVHSSIRCSGALEYNDGIVSNHRALYVDLDPKILLGGNTDDPVTASSREMKRRQKHIWTTWTSIFWIIRSANGSTN